MSSRTSPHKRWIPVWATAVWAGWRPASWIRSPRFNIPAVGYGIRYDYGIFTQVIAGDGGQREIASSWLRLRNVWETPRGNVRYTVRFGGRSRGAALRRGWARRIDGSIPRIFTPSVSIN